MNPLHSQPSNGGGTSGGQPNHNTANDTIHHQPRWELWRTQRDGSRTLVVLDRRPRAADYMPDDSTDGADDQGSSRDEALDDGQAQEHAVNHHAPAPLHGPSHAPVICRDNGDHNQRGANSLPVNNERPDRPGYNQQYERYAPAEAKASPLTSIINDNSTHAVDRNPLPVVDTNDRLPVDDNHPPAANDTHPLDQAQDHSQPGGHEQREMPEGSVDVDAFDEHTRYCALRMYLFKQICEQQSVGSSRSIAPVDNEEQDEPYVQIHRELVMRAEVFLRSPYLSEVKDESYGRIILQLNSTASSSDKGRLLCRPHNAKIDKLCQIGYSRRNCILSTKVGDYVIEMSAFNRDILFDVHDYLRARKAELRAEWLRTNADRAHLLKPEHYETVRDGPRRIPYAASGKDKIIAAKVVQASHHVSDLVEHNKIKRDVLFIRGNPIDGKPGFASRDDSTLINAMTGKRCPDNKAKHAIILEETEELYARLTHFITHANLHQWGP